MPARPTTTPNQAQTGTPPPASTNQRQGGQPPRTPRTPANQGSNGPRRKAKAPTIDLKVPEGTSLRSFRSVGTHPVSDDTLDSLEHLARAFVSNPADIDQYVSSIIIRDSEPAFKHRIELGSYYRALKEDVLRYRFSKYNTGTFWHALRNSIAIIKDTPTSIYIAVADKETSDKIAGRSFVLDIEEANAMPDFTVPSHSPYDDKYYITFDSVPDHHLQTALVKWFALRTTALLTAYNPSRLDDFRGGKFRIVFRTKEVPAVLRLTDTTSLREITVEDEKLGEEVTLVFRHKLNYLNKTIPPSIAGRWADAEARRSRAGLGEPPVDQTNPTQPLAATPPSEVPIVADAAPPAPSSGLAQDPPAQQAAAGLNNSMPVAATAATPVSQPTVTPPSTPPPTPAQPSTPVYFIQDRPEMFYKPTLEAIPTANTFTILRDDEEVEEPDENDEMADDRAATPRQIKIRHGATKKRPNRKHGDPKHLEKLAQRPTKQAVQEIATRVQVAPTPMTIIEQMMAEPHATLAMIDQNPSAARMATHAHVLWREISKHTPGPLRLAALSRMVNEAPTTLKDSVSVTHALVPDATRRMELADVAAFDLFVITYIPDLYFNDDCFAAWTGAAPLRTVSHSDWSDESLEQLVQLPQFRAAIADRQISPYYLRALERFFEAATARAARAASSTGAPEPHQN